MSVSPIKNISFVSEKQSKFIGRLVNWTKKALVGSVMGRKLSQEFNSDRTTDYDEWLNVLLYLSSMKCRKLMIKFKKMVVNKFVINNEFWWKLWNLTQVVTVYQELQTNLSLLHKKFVTRHNTNFLFKYLLSGLYSQPAPSIQSNILHTILD